MEQSRIWHYFQTQAPGSFSAALPRLDFLASLVRTHVETGTILNVGVGGGEFEMLLDENRARTISMDPDPASVSGVAKRTGVQGVAARLQGLPFATGSLDAIVISEVLEHLADEVLDAGLSEMHRVLRKGGWIIGTVPCNEDLSLSTVVCPHCAHVFHKVGHVRSFSAATLRTALSPRFDVTRIRRKAFIRASRMTHFKRFVAALREPLVLSGVLTRDEHLLFTARKP